MICKKCGYGNKKMTNIYGYSLCNVCAHFAPQDLINFQNYISEKIDWKLIDTFRKFGQTPGLKQKSGMAKKANDGNPVTRAPLGYNIQNKELIPNEDSAKVHSLFKTFLNRNYSLNSLARNFSLSTNGLKKVLTNRTYLGEIKFDKKIYKSNHKPLISPEIFYAVQRKLKTYLRPRLKQPTRYD